MAYSTYLPGQTQSYDGRPPYPPQSDRQGPQPSQPVPSSWGNQSGWTPVPPAFSCRPVTSREEAVAVQVDFFGPGTLMPDLSHGMVYLKRFNPETGASDFLDFSYRPPQPAQPPAQPYDPRPEIESLRAELETLRGELEETKKAGAKKTGGKADEK